MLVKNWQLFHGLCHSLLDPQIAPSALSQLASELQWQQLDTLTLVLGRTSVSVSLHILVLLDLHYCM